MTTARTKVEQGEGAIKRCAFPGCELQEEHDGVHFGADIVPPDGTAPVRVQQEGGEQTGFLPPKSGTPQVKPIANERTGRMAVTFRGEVLSVQVKSKKLHANTDDEEVEKIGRLTIQFDGYAVDATALAELVHGRLITLALDNTQRSMFSATITKATVANVDAILDEPKGNNHVDSTGE